MCTLLIMMHHAPIFNHIQQVPLSVFENVTFRWITAPARPQLSSSPSSLSVSSHGTTARPLNCHCPPLILAVNDLQSLHSNINDLKSSLSTPTPTFQVGCSKNSGAAVCRLLAAELDGTAPRSREGAIHRCAIKF